MAKDIFFSLRQPTFLKEGNTSPRRQSPFDSLLLSKALGGVGTFLERVLTFLFLGVLCDLCGFI